jgi:hypothetical protein
MFIFLFCPQRISKIITFEKATDFGIGKKGLLVGRMIRWPQAFSPILMGRLPLGLLIYHDTLASRGLPQPF